MASASAFPSLLGLPRLLGMLSLPLSLCCTLYHSKQALYADAPVSEPPSADARFVTEEDSGLSILGMFVLAEPDHYSVLLERLRRDHRCARLLYPQLDFYTDHWLLIAFPIARVTSLCEPEASGARSQSIPALSNPDDAPAVYPAPSGVAPARLPPPAAPAPDP